MHLFFELMKNPTIIALNVSSHLLFWRTAMCVTFSLGAAQHDPLLQPPTNKMRRIRLCRRLPPGFAPSAF